MAQVKAFKALRYTNKEQLCVNVCPPYDIISEKEREDYINTSDNNIIRLEKPVGENAYAKANELYKAWSADGVIDCDDKDGIYVYEEEFTAYGETKKIRGIFVRVKLHEFSEGVVLPHEETLSKAKEDRFNLMCACGCNFSPIYSMYTDENGVISGKVNECSKSTPEIQFNAKDGVTQRLWKIENTDDIAFIENAFNDKQLFIADGHHRYETALRYCKHLKANGVVNDDSHPANYIMMFLIDMENDGLVVFPTHRVVKGLQDFDEAKVIAAASKYFDVAEISKADIDTSLSDTDKKSFVMCTKKNKFYSFKLKDYAVGSDAYKAVQGFNEGKTHSYLDLDVTVLHSLILEGILGIDKENMANQINLNYTRDTEEAISLANGDNNVNCSFLINATLVSQIKDVALAGEKMPQKSTYFYPKLITGLVMNRILDVEEI